MSKLMWIAGILLIAAGIALGLMVFVSTASVIAWGITLEVAAILLVGGILSLGLGGVINAAGTLAASRAISYPASEAAPAPIPEFGRRTPAEPPPRAFSEAAAPAASAVSAAAEASEEIEVSEPVRETIQALEEARQKIAEAFEAKPSEPEAEEPGRVFVVQRAEAEAAAEVSVVETVEEAVEDEPEAEEQVPAEGQLYVVEERLIRNRPARILSDGTVEAETDEGWMRFENLEHLDEYLDAMSPTAHQG